MAKPTIETREDGLRWIVVKSGWSPEIANLINSGRADGLELNSAAGSWEDGLPFLRDVPGLKHLILIDLQERDVHLIEELHGLEGLKLSAYATSPLDFARLTALRKAFIEWRRQYRNISACTNLEELYLNRYWCRDLAGLRPLQRLTKLTVGDSAALESLQGRNEPASVSRPTRNPKAPGALSPQIRKSYPRGAQSEAMSPSTFARVAFEPA
jgi:Leucine-rich repeat (LRR) protein